MNAAGRSVFVDCLTKPHTSGKFDQNSYQISSGQFGVGLKATTAMSRVMRCITHRIEGTASLTVREGLFNPIPLVDPTYVTATGTVTTYEPDSSIFAGVENYAQTGYLKIVSLLRQLVFFRHRNIVFKISNRPIPESYWDEPDLRKASEFIKQFIAEAPVVWDAKTNDGTEWIKTYWNLHRNFTWSAEIDMSPEERAFYRTYEDPNYARLSDVQLKLYYLKGDRAGGIFALVNSVPILDRGSDHISVVTKQIKDAIASRLPNEKMRQYFLQSYPLALFMAINVDYRGAKFSNAQKTAFREVTFRALYTQLIHTWFTVNPHGISIIDGLYAQLRADIETRYLESLGPKSQSRDSSQAWTRLNKYQNFIDAEPSDGNRKDCELFLLEGRSTGGGQDYDVEHQGIYFMQGKPCNPIRGTGGDSKEVLARMLSHPVISDILTLINFDPRKPDYDNLYFCRVLITADADNLYTVCPLIWK